MKKILSMMLALAMTLFPSAQTQDTIVSPTDATEDAVVLVNQNTLQTNTAFSIAQDGTAYVYVDYLGYKNLTSGAVISVTLEKQTESGEWNIVQNKTYTANGAYYYQTYTYPLENEGTYRCRVVYTVSGIGEPDRIPFEDVKTWHRQKAPDVTTSTVMTEATTPVPTPIKPSVPQITWESDMLAALRAQAYQKHTLTSQTDEVVLIHGGEGCLTQDPIFGDQYLLGENYGIYRYTKGENACYLNCPTADCTHESCNARTVSSSIFSVNGRIYQITSGSIISTAPDGSDRRIEWSTDGSAVMIGGVPGVPLYAGGWRNILPYGSCIYITANDKKGAAHILQYDTTTNTMIDLTAQTGNYLDYEFIYDGELYGFSEDRSDFIKYDLSLRERGNVPKEIKALFTERDFRIHLTDHTALVGILYENGSTSLVTFDLKTGALVCLNADTIGHRISAVLYADENGFYCLDALHRGTLYYVARDGSDVKTVYQEDTVRLYPYQMIVSENNLLLYAQKEGSFNGEKKLYADGWYIGTPDENGYISELHWLNAIS